MQKKLHNQSGFTILEVSLASVLVVVLTAAGLYTFNHVQSSRMATREAAEQKAADEAAKLKVEEAKKAEKVTVPAEETDAKPAPAPASPPAKTETTTTKKTEQKPSYTSITINLADVNINDTRALFSANWSGSYAGKCYLTVKNLTTGTYVSKELSVSGSSCSIEVPKTELSSGSYKYYMTFKNNEYTIKGSSDYKTFNL